MTQPPPLDYSALLQSQGGWSPDVAVVLIVGDPTGGGFVTITSQVPPELIAFYSGFNLARVVIQMYPDANDYWYQVAGTSGNPNAPVFYGEGWVQSGVVTAYRFTTPGNPATIGAEQVFAAQTFVFNTSHTAALDGAILFGDNTVPQQQTNVGFDFCSVTFGNGDDSVGGHPTAGDLIWGTKSLSRGVRNSSSVVTTVGALTGAASAETDIPQLTIFSENVFADRAYRLTCQIAFNSSVATDLFAVNIRRSTALTGTLIATGFGGGAGTSKFFSGTWIYQPPADVINESFFVSFARNSGTGTFTPFGAPSSNVARTLFILEDLCSDFQVADK